ncbi:IS1634 family transposase, partial [Candidatus Poribacteria bacterium]|nr:IS1634 family transposase [Candidatus Poribacteria bacterium]
MQLVENKHTPKGARQKLIISLGKMQVPKELRRSVADRVEALLMGQESFIPVSFEIENNAQEIVNQIRLQGKWMNAKRVAKIDIPDSNLKEVFIDQIKHTNCCEVGSELIALQIFQRLKFDKILQSISFSELEIKIAAVSVLSRLIRPKSENNIKPWIKNTGLPELLNIDPSKITKDRYYRISDKLIQNKETIEKKLAQEETTLFNLKRKIILYDLTNTYFEGECAENTKVKYGGKSKEKRNDCPLIGVGLVIDEEGFPIRHKLFEGNKSDSKTIVETINELKKDIFDETPTIIVDAGMSSEINLKEIKAAGFEYIVMLKRNMRENYSEIFGNEKLFTDISEREEKSAVEIYKQKETKQWTINKKDFMKVEGVEETISEAIWENLKENKYLDEEGNITEKFKLISTENDMQLDIKFADYKGKIITILKQAEYILLYCKSEGRKEKETAIKNKSQQKIEEDLNKLADRIKKGQLINENKINQSIGRIKERHSRVARLYEITIKKENEKQELNWEYKSEENAPEGNYIIKSSRTDLSGEEMWKLYMMLTRIEEAFKNLKSYLGLRPNRHYREDRIDGHIFITILAYHILHTIEHTLRLQKDYRTWTTIKQILETHCYST